MSFGGDEDADEVEGFGDRGGLDAEECGLDVDGDVAEVWGVGLEAEDDEFAEGVWVEGGGVVVEVEAWERVEERVVGFELAGGDEHVVEPPGGFAGGVLVE